MRNSEEPPYLERSGCSRDCECRSYTSQLNIVSYESLQSRPTFEEIKSRLARRTVSDEVTFEDRLGSSTVGLRQERSKEQRLKSVKILTTVLLAMLNSELESCFYVLTSNIGITQSPEKPFLAYARFACIHVGFGRQYTCPSI